MKIYDAHTHVGTDYFLYNIQGFKEFDFSLEELANRMVRNGVSKSIVTLAPSIKEITCCAPTNLVKDGNRIVSQCPKCKKTVAVLDYDPYREYNLGLIRNIRRRNLGDKIIPFFIIHMQNPFLREEIDFYLKNYGKFGIKFHTYVSRKSIMEIREDIADLDMPLLIHSGPEKFTHPKEIIRFARTYKGNILMAHAARLSSKYLGEINSLENLFVDTSPLTSFYRRLGNRNFSTILEKPEAFRDIQSPEDIYPFLIKHVNYKKLLFGTDVPWGDKFGLGYEEEIKILNRLRLDEDVKNHISFKNFENFLNL